MVRRVGGRLAGVGEVVARSERCFYIFSPDHNFLWSVHPDSDAVQVISACSCHGFKHAAAVGEALAAR